MKKYFFLFACFFSVFAVFAEPQFEFGVGSGYVFYGDKDLKNLLSDFDQKSQVILCGDFSVDFPVAEPVKLVFGMDSIMDARWKGSEHFILWDYCGFAGFKIYPGLAGLCTTIQYCLGRRTDFVSLQDIEDYIESTFSFKGTQCLQHVHVQQFTIFCQFCKCKIFSDACCSLWILLNKYCIRSASAQCFDTNSTTS